MPSVPIFPSPPPRAPFPQSRLESSKNYMWVMVAAYVLVSMIIGGRHGGGVAAGVKSGLRGDRERAAATAARRGGGGGGGGQ